MRRSMAPSSKVEVGVGLSWPRRGPWPARSGPRGPGGGTFPPEGVDYADFPARVKRSPRGPWFIKVRLRSNQSFNCTVEECWCESPVIDTRQDGGYNPEA